MKKTNIWTLGIGIIIGVFWEHRRMRSIVEQKIKMIDKFQNYYQLFLAWLKLHERNICFDSYFNLYGINNIAVYGNGPVGKQFLKDMKNTKIQVDYVIDKKAEYMILDIPIITLEQELPKVDAIVITIIDQIEDIAEKIRKRYDYQIISLEDIVYGSSDY